MLGLNLQQVGLDLGTMLGGNYVNRFNIQGRSYKVIPQVKRVQRLNADQLKDIYISGPEWKAGPALDFCDSEANDGTAGDLPVPAIEFRHDPGRHPSGRDAGPSVEGA